MQLDKIELVLPQKHIQIRFHLGNKQYKREVILFNDWDKVNKIGGHLLDLAIEWWGDES